MWIRSSEQPFELRFVLDGMLGGLARWLRMLGYEAEYDPQMSDDMLLQMSLSKGVILLTGDQELHERAEKRSVDSILVQGQTESERLAQLAKDAGISLAIDMATTRCPVCGSQLKQIERSEASRTVPAASLKLYDMFWKCTGSECGKTYWIGSHWKKIRETLDEAQKIARGG